MLIIRRKLDESFVIFSGKDQIEVCVTEIDKNSVKIGISAREGIEIFRRELVDRQGFQLPKTFVVEN